MRQMEIERERERKRENEGDLGHDVTGEDLVKFYFLHEWLVLSKPAMLPSYGYRAIEIVVYT